MSTKKDNKKPRTKVKLGYIVQRMFEEDERDGENCGSDSDFSTENIDTNDFDSLSEQSISDEETAEENTLNENYYIGKDKTTKWIKFENKNVPQIKKVKTEKESVGLEQCAKDINNELDAFFKIIDLDMIDEIIMFTNMYIAGLRTSRAYSRARDCKETTRSEFLAYLGLLYMIGMKKSHFANVKEIWATDGTGVEICRAVMGYKRFLFLTRSLRFDDKSTRAERQITDKLAAIRTFFDAFVDNSKKCFKLSEYTTIDEMLQPFRGRCSWLKCMPSKPARYGIKIYALCDAKTFYTSSLEIDCGKQPDGPYALSNSPFDIVKRLIKPIENTKRNVTTDNYYTSVPLADYLLEKNITLIGTLRKNNPVIPLEFLAHKSKDIQRSLFGFQQDKMLTSYVPRKNAAVILLSTLHHTNNIDPATKQPQVILDYNATKDGVETVEKMCSTYSVSRVTGRWPCVVFFCLMNIGGINSQIVYSFANQSDKKLHRRIFLKNLALSLMKEYLTFRAGLTSLPLHVQGFLKRNYADGTSKEKFREEQPDSKRGKCCLCERDKSKTPASMKCNNCIATFACKLHSLTNNVCVDCANKKSEPDSN